jgi:hypothetical protein
MAISSKDLFSMLTENVSLGYRCISITYLVVSGKEENMKFIDEIDLKYVRRLKDCIGDEAKQVVAELQLAYGYNAQFLPQLFFHWLLPPAAGQIAPGLSLCLFSFDKSSRRVLTEL